MYFNIEFEASIRGQKERKPFMVGFGKPKDSDSTSRKYYK